MSADMLEIRMTRVETRLDKVEQDLSELRKDIRQLLYFVLGTWITTILTFVLAWINLSGQIAGLRPH